MQLKKERGLVFEDLEAKGWLADWQEEEEEEVADLTLQDLELLAGKGGRGGPREETERHSGEYFDRNRSTSESHLKMQKQLLQYA